MVKLLLAFVMAGILLLCAVYCTLAYYRLVSVATTESNHTVGFVRNFFHPKAAVFDRQNRLISGATCLFDYRNRRKHFVPSGHGVFQEILIILRAG